VTLGVVAIFKSW